MLFKERFFDKKTYEMQNILTPNLAFLGGLEIHMKLLESAGSWELRSIGIYGWPPLKCHSRQRMRVNNKALKNTILVHSGPMVYLFDEVCEGD